MSGENYHDTEGNPVMLEKLCRFDPMWATSIIRKLKGDLRIEEK